MQAKLLHIGNQNQHSQHIDSLLQEANGYSLKLIEGFEAGLAQARQEQYDAVLISVDEESPLEDELIRLLQEVCSQCAVLILSETESAPLRKQLMNEGLGEFVLDHEITLERLRRLVDTNILRKRRFLELKTAEQEAKANMRRLELMLEVFAYHDVSEQEYLDFALTKALELTSSKYGYIYYYDEAKEQFTLNTWSKDVMHACAVQEPQTCYELNKTGFWGEAVRQRKAIILNDFHKENPLKKGYPEGHVALNRFMTTPIFEQDKIIAVIGLANKVDPYSDQDVKQIQLMMSGIWNMVTKRRSVLKNKELITAINQTPVSIVITDLHGLIEYVNPYFAELTGYAVDEVIGQNPRILKSGKQSSEFYGVLWECITHGKTWQGELEDKRKDGTYYWEHATITPVLDEKGNVQKFIAVKKDVTHEKHQRDLLESRERLLNETQALANIGGWEFNVQTDQFYWTDAIFQILDADSKAQMDLERTLRCFDDTDQETVQAAFYRCAEEGTPFDFTLPFTTFKGQKKWVRVKTEAIKNAQGKIVKITGALKDVSEEIQTQNQIEAQAKENNERQRFLRTLINSSIAGIGVSDLQGNFTDCNEKLAEMFATTKASLCQKNLRDFTYGEDLPEELEYLGEVMAGQRSDYRLEKRLVKADGQLFWGDLSVSALENHEGELIGLMGVLIDIDDRKLGEEALRQSEQHLRESEAMKSAVIHAMSEGLVVKNKNGTIDLSNQAAYQILGLSKEQLHSEAPLPKAWSVSGEDGSRLSPEEHPTEVTLRTGGKVENFVMCVHKGGDETTYVLVNSRPIKDDSGQTIQAVTTFVDITPQRASEQVVKEIQSRLNFALEGTRAGTWDWEVQSGKTIFNERWAEIVGYTLDELAPISIETWGKLVHPEDNEKSTAALQRHFNREAAHYECKARMRHKSGEWVWVWDRGQVVEWHEDGKPKRMVGTHVDITEWMNAELALKESEDRYRSIYNSLELGVGYYTREGYIISFNDVALRNISKSAEEVEGKHISELFGKEAAQFYMARFEALSTSRSSQEFEDLVPLNGQNHWFRSIYSAAVNEQGEVKGYLIVSDDISHKKATEQALIESEEKYRFVTEALPEVAWRADADGKLNYVNDIGDKHLWLTREALLADGWLRIIHPDDIERVKVHWKQALGSGSVYEEEQRMKVSDGAYHWFKVTATPQFNPLNEIDHWVGISIDIEDRKRAEAKLLEDQMRLSKLVVSSSEIITIEESQSLYQYIADRLFEILDEEVILIITEYSADEASYTVKAIKGPEWFILQAPEALLHELLSAKGKNLAFTLDELRDGKICQFGMNARELSNGILCMETAELLESYLPEHHISSIGLIDNKTILGDVNIIMPNLEMNLDDAFIELFCSQASAALAKLRHLEFLKQSEERFRGVANSFEDITFTLDRKGLVNGVFGSWNSITHIDKDHLLGKDLTAVFGNNEHQLHAQFVKQALLGNAVTYEWNYERSTSPQRFQTTLTPLYDQKSVMGLLGVGRDITDRWNFEQAIMEHTNRLKQLSNYSTELLSFTDRQSIFNYTTKVLYDMLGNQGYVVLASTEETGEVFRIEAIEGMGQSMHQIAEILGIKPIGLTGTMKREILDFMRDDDLVDLPLNVAKLSDKSFAKIFNRTALKALGIQAIKAIMIHNRGKAVATVSFGLPKKDIILNNSLIRAFLNQVSLALERAASVDLILKSETQLRDAQRIAKLGNWSYDAASDRYSFSQEAARILGLEPGDMLSNEGLMNRIYPEDRALVIKEHERLLMGETIEFQHRISTPEGIKWVQIISAPHFENGQLESAEGTLNDISSRKEAELALIKSESRFRGLIEHNATDIIALENTDGIIEYVSPSLKLVLGFEEHELLGKDSTQFVHPDDLAHRASHVNQILNGDEGVLSFKERLKRKDGSFIWAYVTISNQLNIPGIEGIVLNIKNIDQEERYAIALSEINNRYETVLQATSDVMYEHDFDKGYIELSGVYTDVYGYTKNSVTMDEWKSMVHPSDVEAAWGSYEEALNNPNLDRWSGQYRIRHANGDYLWTIELAMIVRDEQGHPVKLIGSLRDISKRMAYEKSIEEQNERLKEVAWMQSHVVRAPLANLMALMELMPLESDPEQRALLDQLILKSASELDNIIRGIVKNAERLHNIDDAVAVVNHQLLAEEIDELYFHPSLLDSAERAYAITNKKNVVVYVNNAYERLTGYSFEQIKRKDILENLLDSKANETEAKAMREKFALRQPFEHDLSCRHASGQCYWARTIAQPFISKQGVFSGYLYTLKNINREKAAEETIQVKNESLERINENLRQFTYTISHDLKEPVNSLKGLVSLLHMQANDKLNDEEKEYVNRSLQSIDRISNMVKALLEYSKSGEIKDQLKQRSFHEMVNEVELVLEDKIKSQSAVIKVIGPDRQLTVYPLLFSRIMQNIVHNSIKFRSKASPRINIELTETQNFWKIAISDNGRGISTDDLDHVFDLFFYKNAEEQSESHGIGLAVVKRFVERHGGQVFVESEEGLGTTFTFTVLKQL